MTSTCTWTHHLYGPCTLNYAQAHTSHNIHITYTRCMYAIVYTQSLRLSHTHPNKIKSEQEREWALVPQLSQCVCLYKGVFSVINAFKMTRMYSCIQNVCAYGVLIYACMNIFIYMCRCALLCPLVAFPTHALKCAEFFRIWCAQEGRMSAW